MKQFSKEEAQAILHSGIWKQWTDEQIVRFQISQSHPIIPFGRFHFTLEKYLGRPVWSNELDFQKEKLAKYIFKNAPEPTESEMKNLIPEYILTVTEPI